MIDHGIKLTLFEIELSCSFFIAFSHLFNAYLAVYVLIHTYKKNSKYISDLFSLIQKAVN